jgi:uncharacterized protein YjiK
MHYVFLSFLTIYLFLFRFNEGSRTGSLHYSGPDSLKLVSVFTTVIPEPSGLVYYPRNNSLLAVSDKKAKIYEINFKGEVLNTFKVHGEDIEGIALSTNQDTIYLAEETKHLISRYHITGKKISSFKVKISTNENHSLEGVTVDNKNRIVVINEKNPCALLKFENDKEVFRRKLDYSRDVSDIFYDKPENVFWVLSDESGCLLKLSAAGTLLKKYYLPFNKGEGIAIVKGKIFIINDLSSKLYVFQKPVE